MSEQARVTFRFVDLKDFTEYLKRDDVQETIREIARKIKREPREQTFGIKRDNRTKPIIVDGLGRRVAPIWSPENDAADVASTLSPQETALAEIADLRKRLSMAEAELKAEAELRIDYGKEIANLRDAERDLRGVTSSRDEWKARAEKAEAEVAAARKKYDDLLESANSNQSQLVDDAMTYLERAEKAEAELAALKADLEDRMPAKWIGDDVYALSAENWRNACEEIEAIGHAVTKARKALAGEDLEEVSS